MDHVAQDFIENLQSLVQRRSINPTSDSLHTDKRREVAESLQSVIQRKSMQLVQARFLEATGNKGQAASLYQGIAESEIWIAEQLKEFGRSAEAAVNLVSAASCWQKLGLQDKAVGLLDEVLSIQEIPVSLKNEVNSLRGEWDKPSNVSINQATYHKEKKSLTQKAFDNFLERLATDRDLAGRKYEMVRNKLVRFFEVRGVSFPEDYADKTIDRVAQRLDDEQIKLASDPASYVFGVARLTLREYWATVQKPLSPLQNADSPSESSEREFERKATELKLECLERCIEKLPERSRELIIQYYQEEKQEKIRHRKELAERLGIPLNALRIRTHRIKEKLEDCVSSCLRQLPLE